MHRSRPNAKLFNNLRKWSVELCPMASSSAKGLKKTFKDFFRIFQHPNQASASDYADWNLGQFNCLLRQLQKSDQNCQNDPVDLFYTQVRNFDLRPLILYSLCVADSLQLLLLSFKIDTRSVQINFFQRLFSERLQSFSSYVIKIFSQTSQWLLAFWVNGMPLPQLLHQRQPICVYIFTRRTVRHR